MITKMANHPLNLALRFALEIAALIAIGSWGWANYDGFLQVVTVIGLPLLGAIVWAVFRVDNDPGEAPVTVPGSLRLGIELTLLLGGAAALYFIEATSLALIAAGLIVFHYLISYQRVLWLVKQ